MKVIIDKKVLKELHKKVPDSLARTILIKSNSLSTDPYPQSSKKLAGQDNYRLRAGVYRVIYSVDKKRKEITILRIAHRREVYKY